MSSVPGVRGWANALPCVWPISVTTTDFFDRYVKGAATALARLQRDGDVPSVASLQATP